MKSRYVNVFAPLGGVAIATVIRHLLQPFVGPLFPFFSYFLVVIVCALFGGALPGAIALIGGYLAGSFFFVSQTGSVIPKSAAEWFGVSFYFLNGSVIVILAERQRRARDEAKANLERSSASEKALQKSLEEIEQLNRQLQRAMAETHHRVKNNLQVISAMVDLQTMQEEETVPKHGLVMIANHIRGLAAIHDLLTQQSRDGGDVDGIPIDQALAKLMPLLQEIAGSRSLTYNSAEIRVPIRQGAAIVVVVNELVSNALKHGLGDVRVEFTADNGVGRLTVSDNGNGFRTDFAPNNERAGLNLVNQIVDWDLRGRITFENLRSGGAKVVVSFPLKPSDQPELSVLPVRVVADEPSKRASVFSN